MIVTLDNGKKVDLDQYYDLSIALRGDETNPRAWYVNPPRFEPVRENGWIGAVAEGGDVNFRDIYFNPHGHCTHTECLGHITKEVHSINKHLTSFFFKAVVISVKPEDQNGDSVITPELLQQLKKFNAIEALVIRTLPNDKDKLVKNYSATNPPYIAIDCLDIINNLEVQHLLIDLPSVDKESDGGELAFHHGYWNVPNSPRFDRTITELIYVPDSVTDGEYLLNLQVANFVNDAAPSRPLLFPMK